MKTKTFAAAALALAGLAAASAGSTEPDIHTPPGQSDGIAQLGHCELRAEGAVLEAFAAPAHAVSWSLDVRAPGFVAQQGGPLFGDAHALERVSRITLVRDPGRGVAPQRSGPIHADLVLHDEAGGIVCEDRIIRRPSRV